MLMYTTDPTIILQVFLDNIFLFINDKTRKSNNLFPNFGMFVLNANRFI